MKRKKGKNYDYRKILQYLKFVKKKPLVAFKLANGYYRTRVLGKLTMRTVDFAVTFRCNSRCEMCSSELMRQTGVRKRRKELTPDEIADIWKQCTALGAAHINFTGGEPMMRGVDDICEITKKLSPKRHVISLVSNSLLLNEKKIKRMADAGLDTLQLSIESVDPEKNDQIRGVPGHYKKVMEAMRAAKKCGLNICLSSVMFHGNEEEIMKLLEFAKRRGTFLILNKASAAGRWKGKEKKKMRQEELKTFEKLLREYPHARSDTVFNYRGGSGCPMIEKVYITAYGEMTTCPHVQISFGNVLEEGVEKVWKRMCSFTDFKEYSRVCKHAFDPEFYDKYLRSIKNLKDRPLPVEKHPYYPQMPRS
jgi:MoaA/NifB/PqqE/SkfB family radical SAM enzyme